MDVTFTNVLEGARQYFQGLPTATSSSAGPTVSSYHPTTSSDNLLCNNNETYTSSHSELPPSSSSYWTTPQQEMARPPTREQTPIQQRPPSHHSDTSRPPSHSQMVAAVAQQEQNRTVNNHQNTYQQEQTTTTTTPQQFQFPRPHSREIATSTPQQQHYQSQLYVQNMTYHQPQSPQQQQQQQQQRVPSRQDATMIPPPSSSASSQTYHQLQNYGQSSQGYHNYQQQQQQQQQQQRVNMPLYPQAKPQTVQNSQEQHPYYKHLYTPHSQNSSQTSPMQYVKPQEHTGGNNTTHNQTTSQSYRTTHNLPPIAALSSISYHSNRNHRDIVRPSFKSNPSTTVSTNFNQIPKTTTRITTNNSASINQQNSINNNKTVYNSENLNYRENSMYYNQQQQQQQNNRLPVSQNYHYNNNNNDNNVNDNNTTPVTTTQSYSQVVMTSSHNNNNNNNTSTSFTTSQIIQNQSSSSSSTNNNNQHYYHQSNKSNHEMQQQRCNDHLSTNLSQQTVSTQQNHHYQQQQQQQQTTSVVTNTSTNNRNLPITKQKRESPLDLSVKTIRTPADSTLDDVDQDARNKYYRTNNSYVNLASITTTRPNPSQLPSATAPKIEFHPNFNVPTLNHHSVNNYKRINDKMMNQYNKTTSGVNSMNRYPTVTVPTSAHVNSYIQSPPQQQQQPTQKRVENLPRIDFPTPGYKPIPSSSSTSSSSYDIQKKRSADTPPSAIIPNKLSKVDTWRQNIDQQIEQRLSSYKQQQLQQQQQQQVAIKSPVVNGNYPNTYQRHQYHHTVGHQPYSNTNQYVQSNHNQTYVPSAVAHQFPGYSSYVPQQQQNIYEQSQQGGLSRTNSTTSLLTTGVNKTPANSNSGGGGGADKRVLSLLRNSLEIKGAKEAQKKLEQEQLQQQQTNRRLDIQHPSTDVQAPLQPKAGSFLNRHNISPFTPTNFPDNNNIYKLHIPKAVDSVNFESETSKYLNINNDNYGKITTTTTNTSNNINNTNTTTTTTIDKIDDNQCIMNHVNPNGDLDGLAAFLAARIRTKAELKQVSPTLNNSRLHNVIENQLKATMSSNNNGNTVSPPKLTKERQLYPPRRRLFSRNEDDQITTVSTTATITAITTTTTTTTAATVPARDKSGLRSSSETSVFDFPDTDSETEMPVLERQTLDDLRRDRKISLKSNNSNNNSESIKMDSPQAPPPPPPPPPLPRLSSPDDELFAQACDSFMEQLKNGNGKKRGRRKKMIEADVLAKLETVTKIDNDIINNTSRKIDNNDDNNSSSAKINDIADNYDDGDNVDDDDDDENDDDDDSDVPLINCKNKLNNSANNLKDNEIKCIIDNDETLKKDSFTLKDIPNFVPRPAKKPLFGDGSHFSPGWEEEVYKYKKSLRMPPRLIQVTRPPQYHRLSTSLPDLDPCPQSPTTPSTIDMNETKTKIKSERIDSDTESNCSINIFNNNNNNNNNNNKTNYDSEGNSSIKSLPNTTTLITTTTTTITTTTRTTISDKLLERYGRKKRKYKRKDDNNRPKILPKPQKIVELLPTPRIDDIKNNIINDSNDKTKSTTILAFRKQTLDNFKDVFNNDHNHVIRTRKQIRLEQQRATIKQVFGEDRPASAPPVTCVNHIKIKEELTDDNISNIVVKNAIKQENDSIVTINNNNNTKQALKNKLLNRGRKNGGTAGGGGNVGENNNLLKNLVEKKIKTELLDNEKQQNENNKKNNNTVVVDDDNEPDYCKSGTPSIDGDECGSITGKKYHRNRNIRRKFSSGFDYIRKKKKQKSKELQQQEQEQQQLQQKEQQDGENFIKTTKRRGLLSNKNKPGTIQDIQKEIKGWVLNKGIGETHLHRSARLGYTDITAYCLEKMECSPSPKDNAGYTPLHEASARGHLDIAKMLLMYGANVSESARGGIRPLHEAVENGYVEIVRLLLSYGADPLLATYSGMTPLALASDEITAKLLQDHIDDIEGKPGPVWNFPGPASCFDLKETGFDILGDIPDEDPPSEIEDIEFEISDNILPNLYTLRGESHNDRWVLLQDLSNMLKIKSRDALLKQICPLSSSSPSSSTSNHQHYKSVLKELKMSDFLEQAHCCQFLNAGEKINTRASKIALVKYTDKVRELLNVEKVNISIR